MLPTWQRKRIAAIDAEFRALAAAIDHERAPLVAGLETISARLHGRQLDAKHTLKASVKTLTRLWYAWEKAGRKSAALVPDYSTDGNTKAMPPELISEIQRLATGETGARDKNGKGIEPTAIWKRLCRDWKAGRHITGIGTWQDWWADRHPHLPLPSTVPDFPWCARTVIRHSGCDALKRWGNIGKAAALKHLPSMERDYSKLRKCELYTLDDVQLDFVAINELTGRVEKMMAYILMEVSSRVIVAFLVKPENSITAADVDELLAHGLQCDGFGLGDGYQTHIWFERGTVACSEAAQKVLEAFSDGGIKIHRTGMDGGVRWVGAAADRATGHSAGKAVIESFNRNLHRRLLEAPGQRGHRFDSQPANLAFGESKAKDPSKSERRTGVSEAERLAQFKLSALAAGVDAKIKLPYLTSMQAQQMVAGAVRDHNTARGHSMQGFHMFTEAEIAPGVWREVETD